MSFMNLFKRTDINKGVEDWITGKDAVLLDVRTVDEYRQGHIDGSLNIPLQNIHAVKNNIPDLDKPIYVHCLSGTYPRCS